MFELHYKVIGMTCNGCLNRVKNALLNLDEVNKVDIDLATGATILSAKKQDLDLQLLQQSIGKYEIVPKVEPKVIEESKANTSDNQKIGILTYKPLLIIVGYIIGVSLLVQYPFKDFSWSLWMRHFMAGFFIVFSFFKLLNIKGFAQSYQMYDIVANRWFSWGYIYPFIELVLGIFYLLDLFPLYTNIATASILGISSIGVIKSNLNKRKIKCACLGDVFDLPMSTVTIIEDVLMVAMALIMIFA